MTYLVLISSFPTIDGNVLFSMARMGKKNWIIGELLFQIMSAITFCAIVVFSTIVQVSQSAFVADGWSLVATDYRKLYKESSAAMDSLLPANLYNQITPYKAFLISLVLLLAWLLLCSVFFLTGCIYSKRMLFFIILIAQIALGCVLCSIKNPYMWLVPICHSFLQVHYQVYFRKYAFSPGASFALLLGMQIVLVILTYRKAKHVNLDMIGGNEKS